MRSGVIEGYLRYLDAIDRTDIQNQKLEPVMLLGHYKNKVHKTGIVIQLGSFL
jgi:hypothetical protein